MSSARTLAVPLALALHLAATPGAAQDADSPAPCLVLRAGVVHPVTSASFLDGALVARDGRIAAVGAAGAVAVPPDCEVVSAPAGWLVPGFVDLHSHVAGGDINDMVFPTNADLTLLDVIIPGREELVEGLAGGVTTTLFIPGSGTNLGGFGVLLKPGGKTLEEMVLRNPGAMKIAQAGNPERSTGEIGTSRLGMNWNLREELRKGREYHDAWTAFEEGRARAQPERVQRLELMRGLFRGEFPVLVHTQWMQVYQATIRQLHDEFGVWFVTGHSSFDSFHNAPLVLDRDVLVNVGPRAFHVDYDTGVVIGLAARWHEAGVKRLSINTDAPVIAEEQLPLQAAMAVRMGLPWEAGLAALTIEPARAMRIEGRVGSLEVGKDADVALWTGDPLDPRSSVIVTVTNGRIVVDHRDPKEPRRW